jgi:hypothetical protein
LYQTTFRVTLILLGILGFTNGRPINGIHIIRLLYIGILENRDSTQQPNTLVRLTVLIIKYPRLNIFNPQRRREVGGVGFRPAKLRGFVCLAAYD